jgi:hypothetical protein
MKKRRNWILIVFGVLVLVVFVGIGAVIAIAAWFQQNLQVQTTNERDAETAFVEVRQKFSTRAPLLEIKNGRPSYAAGRPSASDPTTSLSTLHVLAWDPDDGELARVAVPFWLLRLKSDPIEFSSYASGLDDDGVDLRAEDIERYGPGIILDTTTPGGGRVLLWAQ